MDDQPKIDILKKLFPLKLPFMRDGKWWNGQPDEFSNIGYGLNYSQKFGMTPYAKTGVYGKYNGSIRPHNGHDFAGFFETPIVLPCRAWISFVGYNPFAVKGYDPDGYGNFIFFETDLITLNGESYKMEFVLAHMEKIVNDPFKWYPAGTLVGLMGTTGMSSGYHTHFAGRPWIRQTDGSFAYLFQDEFHQAARGYIDLEPLMNPVPIYDKQTLINQQNYIKSMENKIIIESEKPGRKGVIIKGKLREIKQGRESDACLHVLATNGLGGYVSKSQFDSFPKDKDF